MAKFVPDVKTQRWIIIAPVRQDRPASLASLRSGPSQGGPDEHHGPEKKTVCPFCSGNEKETPPEIMRLGGGEKDTPGWQIRVVPNKFPITDIHEVIIHSPDHNKDIEDFDLSQLEKLLNVYHQRFLEHQNDGHVMIFCNHGEHAGASLAHPHSQLVVIPRQINLDALVKEPVKNIVEDNNFFVTYCPDFSQWPYEVWIAPKKVGTTFADVTDEEMKDLAVILQKTVRRLRVKYEGKLFAYNYYIHHAKDWFIRIIPRFVHRAGFELGTGLSVNIIDPTVAAEELKKIEVE